MALDDEEELGAGASSNSGEDDEQDVMPLDEGDEHDWAGGSNEAKDDVMSGGATTGWHSRDFYGGEDGKDAHDSDEAGSDEDLIFEEAKRLEDIRARRLQGGLGDTLVNLIGPLGAEDADEDLEAKVSDAKTAGEDGAAEFASVFAPAAEHTTVERDFSKMSAEKKRAIITKESPELVPLLEDFREKLAGLRTLMPLMAPSALDGMPATGASYMTSKLSLILNTLANLSFYVLLRAEGRPVRAHPVITQLVWLRELHEKVAPLDVRLSKKLQLALRAARRVGKTARAKGAKEPPAPTGALARPPDNATLQALKMSEAPSRPRRSVRERLLGVELPADTARKLNTAVEVPERRVGLATEDLLRLPGGKRPRARFKGDAASAPEDLRDDDPVLGAWRPRKTVAEELSGAQRHLQDQTAKADAARGAPELNPEAKKRKKRERAKEEPLEGHEAPEVEETTLPGGDVSGGEEDEHEMIINARRKTKAKKDKKAEAERQRSEHKLLRQFKPEDELKSKRKISKAIDKNRGLVRARKKTSGNARVSYRRKYEKKIKARKGQVQAVREAPSQYNGVDSGIRTHVVHSQKLPS